MARGDYEHLSREELLAVIERLEARIAQQDAHVVRLDARIKRLEELLDQATRDGKRQAVPFSKGPPQPDPQKPGRRPGAPAARVPDGRHAHREAPSTPPDEIIDVPLPRACLDCGGTVREETVVHQHQLEISRQPICGTGVPPVTTPARRRCHSRCGRRVQPRHPLQTSDALGAAACGTGRRPCAGHLPSRRRCCRIRPP